MPFVDFVDLLISIKTKNGTFICAQDNGTVDTQKQVGPWEKWSVISHNDGRFSFKSAHGKYLRAEPVRIGIPTDKIPSPFLVEPIAKVDQADKIDFWEKFEVVDHGNDVYSFKTHHGTYLRGDDDRKVSCHDHSIKEREKFTVEVVSECLEVYDVKYNLNHHQILSTIPKSIGTQTVSNSSDIQQSMSISISQQYSTKHSFTQTYGLKLGVKATGEIGIPFVANGKIEISAEISGSWTIGEEETVTKTFQATLPLLVPPHSRISSRVTFNESSMYVDWTAKASWSGMSGKVAKDISGVWRGVTLSDVHYTVDSAVRI